MIRIALCQPSLRRYRTPVYDLLAAQPELDLTVFVGDVEERANVDATGHRFATEPAPITTKKIGSLTFQYQQAQIDAIDPERFDLAILPWDTHYRSLNKAIKKAHSMRLPTVLWGHGYSKDPSRIRDTIRNQLGKKAHGVMLYSFTVADRLIANQGFTASRVFVAPNAIDQNPIQKALQHWRNNPPELTAFQAKHQLDPHRTIIFVSRLLAENRIVMLLDVLAVLRRSQPNLKLVIVGDGPNRPHLETAAHQLKLTECVTFTGAIHDEHELAPWMCSSAVFCYPVNIGLSILTAFGFGLPVVTSDKIVSHNPEIEALHVDHNGLTYREGDVEDLARKLAIILNDVEFRKHLSTEAHRTATQTYTIKNSLDYFAIVVGSSEYLPGDRKKLCADYCPGRKSSNQGRGNRHTLQIR